MVLSRLRSGLPTHLEEPAPSVFQSLRGSFVVMRREVVAYEHVPHGFRTTASTNLNEANWNSDWIEAQLSHVQENKVRAAYNAAQYLEGRQKMMQCWADWLDTAEASSTRL